MPNKLHINALVIYSLYTHVKVTYEHPNGKPYPRLLIQFQHQVDVHDDAERRQNGYKRNLHRTISHSYCFQNPDQRTAQKINSHSWKKNSPRNSTHESTRTTRSRHHTSLTTHWMRHAVHRYTNMDMPSQRRQHFAWVILIAVWSSMCSTVYSSATQMLFMLTVDLSCCAVSNVVTSDLSALILSAKLDQRLYMD